MAQSSRAQNVISRLPANPTVATICSIAGIVATPVFGLLSYQQGSHSRNLRFSVDKARAVIVSPQRPSRLSVSFDAQPVQSDITAAQVAFWNAGNDSIKRSNILKPLVISTANNIPILEATIRKPGRDVAGISLDQSDIRNGRLLVNWDILEQNDGASVQIIYSGNQETVLFARAVIESQGQVNGSSEDLSTSASRTHFYWKIIFGLTVTYLALSSVMSRSGAKQPDVRYRLFGVLVQLVGMVGVFAMLVVVFFLKPDVPPFGYRAGYLQD